MPEISHTLDSCALRITADGRCITNLTEIGFVVTHEGQSGSFVLSLELRDMINLYRVRDAIESEAAALCALTADDRTIHSLYSLAEAFRDSVISRDYVGMKETDMPFHRMIIDSCANPYIVSSYEQLLPKLTMYQSSMLHFLGDSSSIANPWLPSVKYNHVSVVSAIRMRMPDMARQAMSEHVDASLNFTALCGNGSDPFHAMLEK